MGYLTASLRVAVGSVEFIDFGHKGCVRAGLFADHTKPRHMLSQLPYRVNSARDARGSMKPAATSALRSSYWITKWEMLGFFQGV